MKRFMPLLGEEISELSTVQFHPQRSIHLIQMNHLSQDLLLGALSHSFTLKIACCIKDLDSVFHLLHQAERYSLTGERQCSSVGALQ